MHLHYITCSTSQANKPLYNTSQHYKGTLQLWATQTFRPKCPQLVLTQVLSKISPSWRPSCGHFDASLLGPHYGKRYAILLLHANMVGVTFSLLSLLMVDFTNSELINSTRGVQTAELWTPEYAVQGHMRCETRLSSVLSFRGRTVCCVRSRPFCASSHWYCCSYSSLAFVWPKGGGVKCIVHHCGIICPPLLAHGGALVR